MRMSELSSGGGVADAGAINALLPSPMTTASDVSAATGSLSRPAVLVIEVIQLADRAPRMCCPRVWLPTPSRGGGSERHGVSKSAGAGEGWGSFTRELRGRRSVGLTRPASLRVTRTLHR